MTTPRLLLVDDDSDHSSLLAQLLSGYQVETTTSPLTAIDLVRTKSFDVVLTDLSMPQLSGEALCVRLLEACPNLPIIVVTGNGSVEGAVAAMRAGAFDFVAKPVDAKLLEVAVARAVKHARLQSEVKRLREQEIEHKPLGELIGDSAPIQRVQDLVKRVGPSDASVLIWGETGTGKELVARALHAVSNRKDGPFVAINCAAVPAALLESELFGHARGAFTDAKQARNGLFARASGGTLFLDEIGEMPLEMQAKLLRALQERVVRPVGSDAEVPFDARVIAATHRDLDKEIGANRFRQDLYFRINVVRIDLPPLRARGSDTLRLAQHFLAAHAKRTGTDPLQIGPQVAERLLGYDWPGNVRELENCIERAVALAQSETIAVDDLPERIRAHQPERVPIATVEPEELITVHELEKRYVLRVLRLMGDNRSRTAQILGLDRRTLYRKLDEYKVKRLQPLGSPSSQEGVPS